MTRSALAAKVVSGGLRDFSSSCQPGQRSVGQCAKAGGGGGLLWRWDPALSTSILCQAGQRGPSAPMELTPEWQHVCTGCKIARSRPAVAECGDSACPARIQHGMLAS
eukprot:354659-Chlamydomonas_euryale.AAC.3